MAEPKDPQKEYISQMSAVLSTLKQAPGWDLYVDLLTDVRGRKVIELLADGKERFDFHRGVIEGLNLLLSIPDVYKKYAASN